MVLMKDPEDLHLSAAEIIVLAFNRTSAPGGKLVPQSQPARPARTAQ